MMGTSPKEKICGTAKIIGRWCGVPRTVCVTVYDYAYAVFNLALARSYGSRWYLTVAAMMFSLGTMRFAIVLIPKKGGKSTAGLSYMLSTALMLLLLNVVLAVMVHMTAVGSGTAEPHGMSVMIAIAAYTFTKLGFVVAKAVSKKRDRGPLAVSMRHIVYAETAVSIVSLQRSMIVSVGHESIEWGIRMNLATGIAACIFIAYLGLALLIRGRGLARSYATSGRATFRNKSSEDGELSS